MKPGRTELWLFLAGLFPRLLFLSQYAACPFVFRPSLDSLGHHLMAQRIAAGTVDPAPFFRAPLYDHFLAAIYTVVGPDLWISRGIQCVIGAVVVVLVYRLGLELAGRTVALAAAVATAFYAPLVFFDGELLSANLEVFLVIVTVTSIERATSRTSLGSGALAGLLLGVTAITRPNVLFTLPAALWWIARGAPTAAPRATRTRLALTFLAAAVLLPLLVTLRNRMVGGDWVFIAHQGGINLHVGNRPEADGFTVSTPRHFRFESEYEDSVALYGQKAAEEALGRPLKPSEAQSYWVGRVLTWWREHPGDAIRLTGWKIVLFWSHQEIRNNHGFEFVRSEYAPMLWFCPIGFAFAGTLGLAGMAIAWYRLPRSRFLTLFILLYFLSFLPFFAADRFRLPLVPLLNILGSWLLITLVTALRERRLDLVARPVIFLIPAALLVNVTWIKTDSPQQWAADHWAAGNGYGEINRWPEAIDAYRKALALDPGDHKIWLNLGGAYYSLQDYPEAEKCFIRTLELDSTNADACHNLAVLAVGRGDHARARLFLAETFKRDPAHPLALELKKEVDALPGG